jgi:transposase-like protein
LDRENKSGGIKEATINPVQNGRGRKRRWPAEQKLAVLQEWKNGILLEEVCRKYAVNAARMYRWKRSLDQGLKESGDLVSKSQVLGLQKRVEELEWALVRKALEVDLFKKPTSSRGSDYPRGHKMAGTEYGLFDGVRVPDVQQVSELALLPALTQPWTARAATGGRGRDRTAPRSELRVLRLPTAARAPQVSRGGVQSQDGVAGAAAAGLAGDGAACEDTGWATARGGRCAWPNPIGAGLRTSPGSGRGMDRRGGWL